MSDTAATPRPSSTVILLRDEADGPAPFSVLMLERHGSIAFPGAHVFPGGIVDAADADAPGARLPASQRWASPGEGDRPPDALPYWVAAARELFEEVGILLAARGDTLLDGPLPSDVLALRPRLHAGEPLPCLLREVGLRLATEQLLYFARWITPTINPKRWDTRFLVGRTPRGQEPVVDGTETVSCRWYTPRAALDAYLAGQIVLIPPTVRTLDDLTRFGSVDDVLADAAQRIVRALTPEIVQDGRRTSLSYPDAGGPNVARKLELRDGRWRPSDD